MKRRTLMGTTVFCAAMIACLMPSVARAQATGAIAGVITDETGAVMPGVTIETTNTATGQTRSVVCFRYLTRPHR